MMASHVLTALSPEEKAELRKPHGTYPNRKHPGLEEAYKRCYQDMLARVKDQRGNIPAGVKLAQAKSVKKAAKKWTKRLLQFGDVHARPPHKKGYKDEDPERKAGLANIRAMILEGCPDGNGGRTLYRDIAHLRDENEEEYEREKQRTGLKTPKSIWIHLKKAYPKMAKVTLRLKKVRAAAKVKVLLIAAHNYCLLVVVCDIC